jgi:hypothetical protein
MSGLMFHVLLVTVTQVCRALSLERPLPRDNSFRHELFTTSQVFLMAEICGPLSRKCKMFRDNCLQNYVIYMQ